MATSRSFLLLTAVALLGLFTKSTFGLPINVQQRPLIGEDHSVACDAVDIYTTEWFLLNTLPQYRREIHSKALFYTKGTSKQARQLACHSREFVTLWDIWPGYLYDDKDVPTNKLRCIHNDRALAMTFYENMSRAYARMARKHATIMHSFADYAAPPLNGIWGRVELPAIETSTDIYELDKINEDRSLSDVFHVPHKAARVIFERAISEVQALFRQARTSFRGNQDSEAIGSCSIWNSESVGFLDSLF